MSRDSSGNYTLPAGNPVVTGTTIESTWANTTMTDLAVALTNSLDRTGKGGMLAPLYFDDGLVSLPAISFTNEQTSGIYRNTAGDIRLSIQGVDSVKWVQSGQTINSVTADATAGPDMTVFRNSATPAASDQIGRFKIDGRNSGGGQVSYGMIGGIIQDPTAAAEEGIMQFSVLNAGSLSVSMQINSDTSVTFTSGIAAGDTTLNSLTVLNDLTVNTDTLYVDSATGYVGIQNLDPIVPLHVKGPALLETSEPVYYGRPAENPLITDQSVLAALQGQGYSDTDVATNSASLICRASEVWSPTSAPSHIELYTTPSGSLSSSERMRIDASGNVGIGSSDAAGRKLRVEGTTNEDAYITIVNTLANGTSTLGLGDAAQDNIGYVQYNNANDALSLGANGVTRQVINSAGRAAFQNGTGNVLYVEAGRGAGTSDAIWSNATTVPMQIGLLNGGNTENLDFFCQGSGAIRFIGGASAERMRIDSAGNVGIGESSPSVPLHIKSTAAGQLRLEADSATIGPNIEFANSGGNLARIASAETNTLRFEVGPTNAEAMRIDSAGDVGIGETSPDRRLHVKDTAQVVAKIESTNTRSYLEFFDSGTTNANGPLIGSAANDLIVATGASNNERMRIDSSGNLLVGTTSSLARLAVSGSGTTSATFGLQVRNGAGSVNFYARDDGAIATGLLTNSPYNLTTASAANMYVSAGGFLQRSTSSARYKENIRDYEPSAGIEALRPVFFNSKSEGDEKLYAGFIAEEVAQAGLSEFVEFNDIGQPDAVFYQNMVALCVKELQQLRTRVATLETQ